MTPCLIEPYCCEYNFLFIPPYRYSDDDTIYCHYLILVSIMVILGAISGFHYHKYIIFFCKVSKFHFSSLALKSKNAVSIQNTCSRLFCNNHIPLIIQTFCYSTVSVQLVHSSCKMTTNYLPMVKNN
jgi:hypothetical protein